MIRCVHRCAAVPRPQGRAAGAAAASAPAPRRRRCRYHCIATLRARRYTALRRWPALMPCTRGCVVVALPFMALWRAGHVGSERVAAGCAPGQAWPPLLRVVCMYCQVMHRTVLYLLYHSRSPHLPSSGSYRPLPHLDAMLPHTHDHTGTPKGSTQALNTQPLPSLVRLCPHAAMPCHVLAGPH